MPRVLVLAAKRTEYVSKKTQQPVRFANVTFVMGDPKQTPEERGVEVVTMDAPFNSFLDMDVVPGFYDVEFSVKKAWNGEVEPALGSMRFVEAMRLDFDGVMTVKAPVQK